MMQPKLSNRPEAGTIKPHHLDAFTARLQGTEGAHIRQTAYDHQIHGEAVVERGNKDVEL